METHHLQLPQVQAVEAEPQDNLIAGRLLREILEDQLTECIRLHLVEQAGTAALLLIVLMGMVGMVEMAEVQAILIVIPAPVGFMEPKVA